MISKLSGVAVATLSAVLIGFGCGEGADTGGNERVSASAQPLAETVEAPASRGAVTTFAGTGVRGNADGALAAATFNEPASLAIGPDGAIYVADYGNNSIRRIKDGAVSTVIKGQGNLLKNPGCDEIASGVTNIPFWTGTSRERPKVQCLDGSCGHAFDGMASCYGGASFNPNPLTQTVDVASFATNIDNGKQKFEVSGWWRNASAERCSFKVDFLSASDVSLGSHTSEEVNSPRWTAFKATPNVPVNTRRIRLQLIGRATSGTDANSYFDSLSVRPLPVAGADPALDRGMDRPKSVAADPGGLWIAADGIYRASFDGTSVTKVATSGGFVPPSRAVSVSVARSGSVIVTDGLSARLYLNTPGVGWHYGDLPVSAAVIGAVGGDFEQGNKLFVWTIARGHHTIVGYLCAKATSVGQVVGCEAASATSSPRWPAPILGASAGSVDDVDGAAGGERFYYPSTLSLGLNLQASRPDVFVSEEGNSLVRRNFADFTRLAAGGYSRGHHDAAPPWYASFDSPGGVAVAGDGSLFVADRRNNRVRKVGCGGAGICSQSGSVYGVPAFGACMATPTADDTPCTTDTCEVIAVRHRPKAAGDTCEDGNLCNGTERCDASGACQPGTPVAVGDDNNSCTIQYCDPKLGATSRLAPVGTACFEGTCSLAGNCNASGTCVSGGTLPVDDGNDCTVDACGAQGVTHTPKAVGTSCTLASGSGTCAAGGVCVSTTTNAQLPSGTVDRGVPFPFSGRLDDLLAVNHAQGPQVGATACIQTTATPTCAFLPTHMALIRGSVQDAAGAPLADVTISVPNHPEFGSSKSLSNGEFFMVVNGGGPLTLRASKANLLSSERHVNPAWGATEITAPIRLLALDPTVTTVTFAAPGGSLASGTIIPAGNGDGSGERKAAVFFPSDAGPSANGSSLASAKFRITEYTVGANGEDRMPAEVAGNTMYTYAAEFSLEDSAGNVYNDVQFNKPVISYVTNFLNMSPCFSMQLDPTDGVTKCVGDDVPVGYYNRAKGRWEPMDGGRVIKIEAVSGGVATVSGVRHTDVPLTPDERQKLGSYPAGTTLWRLPLIHFSPLDFNLGIGAPACEVVSGTTVCAGPITNEVTGGNDAPADGSCRMSGSIIDVERQVLRENFDIVGTPYQLAYSSENTMGYGWNKSLGIDLGSHPRHSKLKGFVVDFKVAGQRVVHGGLPLSTGKYQTTWNGLDYHGQRVNGSVTALLDVGAVYRAERRGTSRFGSTQGNVVVFPELSGTRADPDITIWSRHYKTLNVWDAGQLGFGGWSFSHHHAFDPQSKTVHLGDGTHYESNGLDGILTRVAGQVNVDGGHSPDGTPALSAKFNTIHSIAFNRDGELFLTTSYGVVRKINVANGQFGTVRDYAGKYWGSGGTVNMSGPDLAPKPALGLYLQYPTSIAFHDDGRLVISDHGTLRVYEVSRDGSTIRTIAGRGNGTRISACGNIPDNTPAGPSMQNPTGGIDLCFPSQVATGPDGSVYVIDSARAGGYLYVIRIDPSGLASIVVGDPNGTLSQLVDDAPIGTPAKNVTAIHMGLLVDRDNTLWIPLSKKLAYFATDMQLRKLNFSAGQGFIEYDNGTDSMSVALFPNGDLLRATNDSGSVYHLQRCTRSGKCRLIAGAPAWTNTPSNTGFPAVGSVINSPTGVAVGPDGFAYVAQTNHNRGYNIFRIETSPVGDGGPQCRFSVPSQDTREVYCFNEKGWHTSTHDALTGSLVRSFTPDGSGLLAQVTDASGTTSIDRSVANRVRITSPNNQLTEMILTSTGWNYADKIVGAGTLDVTHDAHSGLLTSLVDVNQQQHTFSYDGQGRLTKDVNPAGGYQLLSRVDDSPNKYTVNATSRLGKTRSYSREILADGRERRTVKRPDGLANTSTIERDGTRTTTMADGSVHTWKPGKDARFKYAAKVVGASSVKMPTGPTTAYQYSTVTNSTLALDGKSFADQLVMTGAPNTNGGATRTFERAYDHSTKTVTYKTPAGRQYSVTLDSRGRAVKLQAPGEVAMDWQFNATTGQLEWFQQGSARRIKFNYSTAGTNQGFLTALSDFHDSANLTPIMTALAPDQFGRPSTINRQSSDALLTGLSWTGGGQLQIVTTPRDHTHGLTYDARGYLKKYTPPLATDQGATHYRRDLDGAFESITAPGADSVAFVNDPTTGRLTQLLLGSAETQSQISYEYWPSGAGCTAGCAPGRIKQATDSRSGVVTSSAWYGSLPASISQLGTTITWNYNNNLWVQDETVSRTGYSSKVTLGYDDDGAVTCASLGTCTTGDRVNLAYETSTGRLDIVTVNGALAEDYEYNAYGELVSQANSPLRIDYADGTYPRDALGRVKVRKTRIGTGGTATTTYEYDVNGRLWKATTGATIHEYQYDEHGNRTYAKNSQGTVTAADIVYDEQDRLIRYGGIEFEYSPKGDLMRRHGAGGEYVFDYDALGRLRFVQLPDGRTIDYVIDAYGRRVGKKVNGALVKQWVYGSGRGPIAELDGSNNVTKRFVYGSKPNVPDLIKTSDKLYRLFSDQLGTPLVIYNVTDNVIADFFTFDEFGVKTVGTFDIPFGFAGGLYDVDTGLTRFGAREYDASIGRWVSKDPILFASGQTNLYAYINNDPVNLSDPSGLDPTASPKPGVKDGVSRVGKRIGVAKVIGELLKKTVAHDNEHLEDAISVAEVCAPYPMACAWFLGANVAAAGFFPGLQDTLPMEDQWQLLPDHERVCSMPEEAVEREEPLAMTVPPDEDVRSVPVPFIAY